MTNLFDVRAEEFDVIWHFFKPGMRVLEMGGGTGPLSRVIGSATRVFVLRKAT